MGGYGQGRHSGPSIQGDSPRLVRSIQILEKEGVWWKTFIFTKEENNFLTFSFFIELMSYIWKYWLNSYYLARKFIDTLMYVFVFKKKITDKRWKIAHYLYAISFNINHSLQGFWQAYLPPKTIQKQNNWEHYDKNLLSLEFSLLQWELLNQGHYSSLICTWTGCE